MSTKPKFDPERVANLLKLGKAEARGEARPLISVPAGDTTSSSLSVPMAAVPAPAVVSDDEMPVPEAEPAGREKRAITVRLSDEVLSALYRHQAEVRCLPGSRLKDTTIGGVIDTLLRTSLTLPPAVR